jgi:hypothetical protein
MTRGFRVADLATRAAYGRIIDCEEIDCPSGLLPKKLKVSADTRVVEISEVLAPSLILPLPYRLQGGEARRPTLGDCANHVAGAPFLLVIPLTMLKPHVESPTIRIYNEQCVLTPSHHRRVTPPLRSEERETNTASSSARDDIYEADVLNEDLLEAPATEQDMDDLASDPDEEMRPELLAAIDTAEVAAANSETGLLLMASGKLDAAPDNIEDVFSSVLGDVFHAMDRAKVRVKHEYKKPYYVALMRAFLPWDEVRLQEVFSAMQNHGYSEKELESWLFFRPSYFQRLVERIVLPPSQLYWRVRCVFEVFGGKIDSETKVPLFNENAWAKANNLLREILLGLYSDPPGYNFYTLEVDTSGKVKKNVHGLGLIRCCRGTNSVENAHRLATKWETV